MKYLFYNDIKSLFKDKSLKLIMIVLILELIFQFIIIDDNIINLILGRNFEDIRYYIATLFFLLHILLFTYVSLNIYLKDIIYNLDNIFLRIHPAIFIIEKILFIFVAVIIIRLLEYLAIIPILIKTSYSLKLLSVNFIKDLLFYMMFSLCIVLTREYKWLIGEKSIILFVVFTILIPKNIDFLYIYYLMIIVMFIISTIISMNIYSKKIIEIEGGVK